MRAEAGLDSEAAALAKTELKTVEAGAAESGTAAQAAKAETTTAQAATTEANAASSSTHFLDATGQVSDVPLLQQGQAGQQQLARLMDGYTAPQNKVFVDSVNRYAQQIIEGTFDWSRIPDAERIVLDGNAVLSGNHRFIAAKLAAQTTGRPLMGTANAIIPSQGFASEQVTQAILRTGAPDLQSYNSVAVVAGAKPPPVTYGGIDSDLQLIRDATNE